MFTRREIIRWLGLTAFEITLQLIAVFVFSILVVVKVEGILIQSWWTVFIPLFTYDGLGAYFCVILFIRTLHKGRYKAAFMNLISSACILICKFLWEFLLCQKLNKENSLSYSEVFAPIFILLQLIMVRGCQMNM